MVLQPPWPALLAHRHPVVDDACSEWLGYTIWYHGVENTKHAGAVVVRRRIAFTSQKKSGVRVILFTIAAPLVQARPFHGSQCLTTHIF